jgi:hypothetical protein
MHLADILSKFVDLNGYTMILTEMTSSVIILETPEPQGSGGEENVLSILIIIINQDESGGLQ